AVEILLYGIDPCHQPGQEAGGRQGRLARADAERIGHGHCGRKKKNRQGRERQGNCRPRPHQGSEHVTSSRVAKILLKSLLSPGSKNASVSDCWFWAIASSGSGRTTARPQ